MPSCWHWCPSRAVSSTVDRRGRGPTLRNDLRVLLLLSLVATVAVGGVPPEFSGLTSSFATLDGARVHYWIQGEGQKAVVFVHGWGCDATVWRFQTSALPEGWRALYVDLPGHGESDAPDEIYSMEYLARGVAASMKDAGVERAVLVGHSNGVPVVRQFYRIYPEKTQGIMAVEGSFRPLVSDPETWNQMIAPFRAENYLEAVERMIPADLSAELTRDIRSMMLATPQKVLVSSLEGVGEAEIWAEDPIAVPLLVLLAESPFWTPDYEQFVRGLAPYVDYRVVAKASHFLQLDNPDRFNEALAALLSQLSSHSADGR